MAQYDVIIVGGGPGGLFAALEMAGSGLSTLLLERGRDIEKRGCPIQEGKVEVCPPCVPCHVVSGLGGAGAFSDGKLTLSTSVGGRLADYTGLKAAKSLISYVDDVYLRLGASYQLYGVGPEVEGLRRRAAMVDLRLIPTPVRHVGTERCRSVLQGLRNHLSSRLDIRLGVAATSIVTSNGRVVGVDTDRGERHACDYLVVGPGQEGAEWLMKEASRLGLKRYDNPVDLGVRVELQAAVLEEFTRALYEAKMEYFSR
ncbi:MAG: FAD-dependent oxidoreductase, partial [Dehalococcoidia bacterium]|nr:FAD-dependent oxidoreductase [Dehalococcoidia bacterium]